MNKLQYNMTQILNELQTFEAISKTRPKEGEANVVEHKPSSFSIIKNKKRKNTRWVWSITQEKNQRQGKEEQSQGQET